MLKRQRHRWGTRISLAALAVIVLLAACGSSSPSEIQLSSRANRTMVDPVCPEGSPICRTNDLDDLGPPPPELISAINRQNSFTGDVFIIGCNGKAFDPDAAELRIGHTGEANGRFTPQGVACVGDFPEHDVETHAGERATMTASRRAWFVDVRRVNSLRCGDTEHGLVAGLNILTPVAGFDVETIEFANGGRAELTAARGVFYENEDCLLEVGTWRGTAGPIDGAEGDYTYVWDGLQLRISLLPEGETGLLFEVQPPEAGAPSGVWVFEDIARENDGRPAGPAPCLEESVLIPAGESVQTTALGGIAFEAPEALDVGLAPAPSAIFEITAKDTAEHWVTLVGPVADNADRTVEGKLIERVLGGRVGLYGDRIAVLGTTAVEVTTTGSSSAPLSSVRADDGTEVPIAVGDTFWFIGTSRGVFAAVAGRSEGAVELARALLPTLSLIDPSTCR